MKKIMFIFGTRPEFIKMYPVIEEFKSIFDVLIVNTGQHKEMLDLLLDEFNTVCDYNLSVMEKSVGLTSILTNTINALDEVFTLEKPDFTFVHGDTSATMAGGIVSFYHQVPIGHIEAGLRTNDKFSPFPEEMNRQFVGLVADLHFTPTEVTRQNLLLENKPDNSIFVVGNSAIDTLNYTIDDCYVSKYDSWVGDDKLILVTVHRRENLDKLEEIFEAFESICEANSNVKIIYPIHLNPMIREIASEKLKSSNIKIVEPMGTTEFHNMLNKAYFILTDSGGIQEEAPSLGVPVLVMRDTTERPEGVSAGTLKLIGTKKEDIIEKSLELLNDEGMYKNMSEVTNPYGDGDTSKKIVNIVGGYFESK